MTDLYRPFDVLMEARFLSRPNRFVVCAECDGSEVAAFLPNPGRLRELLLPGRAIYLTEEDSKDRKMRYTVVGVERDGCPVMLHTHRTNLVVSRLLEEGLVPGFEGATVARREISVGRSRFDFLLRDGSGDIYLEVKSCTLFGKRVAMFPDAVTARGARHLRELAELARGGCRSAAIFVVQWPRAEVFMPDYHTDLDFARTFMEVRHSVHLLPIAVEWLPGLSLSRRVKALHIPWKYVEVEARDRGSYILILELNEDRLLTVGAGGERLFRKGYYLYVGSAMASLSARLERHLRRRKRFHWHIDWLRSHATVRAVVPVRASVRLECDIADALSSLSDWSIPGFGCADCSCGTHLFAMNEDPLGRPSFHQLVQYFRMDRFRETGIGPEPSVPPFVGR
jgi:sugar fermentation stimulation protein A